MNQQEIFDKVASHLIAQGKQSLRTTNQQWNDQGCAYRGDNGTMCAAGCLIPDEEYKPEFEGRSWTKIQEKIPSLASLASKESDLIGVLQNLHDSYVDWSSKDSLKEELRNVACRFNLSTDILN